MEMRVQNSSQEKNDLTLIESKELEINLIKRV